MHGEAKTQHGLRRAVRCGLANMSIQAYLTAAVINLKRLATHAGGIFDVFCGNLANILTVLTSIIAMRVFLINCTRKLNWKMSR
jgi:hypothetical protein